MATDWKTSFEGGTLQGPMTQTQSGPGETSFTAYAGSATYSNTHVAGDGGSLAFRSESSSAVTARWSPGTGNIRCALSRGYFWLDTLNGTSAAPGTELVLLQMGHSGGGAGNLQLSTAGSIRYNAAGSYGPVGITLPLAQYVRWVLWIDAGTTAGNDSRLRAGIYSGNSTTPLWDSGLVTGLNLSAGTGLLTDFRFGKYTFPTYASAFWMDAIGLRFGGTEVVYDPWPALTSNASPTGSVGSDKTATVGEPCPVSAAAADTDGTIASYLWTITSGPSTTDPAFTNATSANASFVPTALGTYIVRCTWTDNLGATGYDELNVTAGLPTSTTTTGGGLEYAWSGSAWK